MMAGPTFEEQNQPVLQSIEYAIVGVWRAQPALVDAEVESALEALIARYSAEATGREPRAVSLDASRRAVFDAVLPVCEWVRGRASAGGGESVGVEIASAGVLVDCLKRIRKSLQRWTKQMGRQGYLTFVSRYVPA
jgi:hypothetical protein